MNHCCSDADAVPVLYVAVRPIDHGLILVSTFSDPSVITCEPFIDEVDYERSRPT